MKFGAQPELVQRLLQELIDNDEQSDTRFAEQLCRSRFQNGRGPVKLRYDLAQHQICESVVEQVMADYHDKWQQLAGEVRQKKFGDQAPASYREWARQARFLQQRGFAAEHIDPFHE